MQIAVQGLRVSPSDWEAVRQLPREQLPALTREQLAAAEELRISAENYARSALAGQRTTDRLLGKTERFARLLEERIKVRNSQATVERVVLNTWEDKFEIEIRIDGTPLSLRIDEAIMDDLFESGSLDAEQRLSRILDLTVQQRVA